ncbi:MAG: hypothetical protein P8J59_09845 [Phycisphaerales bacterium]|jgi:hypothetical protein|nr:hypothetical protein [Phycisphaerales bacterium]
MKHRQTPVLSVLVAAVGIFVVGMMVGSSMAATTPPKDEPGGKSQAPVEGQPKKAESRQRTTRAGSSESMWFDALSQVQVTAEQRAAITPMVRDYLAKSKAWRETKGVELKAITQEIKRIREEGGTVSPELMARVRVLRSSLPRLLAVQDAVSARMTTNQVESLYATIDQLKQAERARVRAERAAKAESAKGASGSAADPRRVPQKQETSPSAEDPGKDDPQKPVEKPEAKKELPWSFIE